MRTSALRILLGLALIVAAPWALADVQFGGQLGLSLIQTDSWSGATDSSHTVYWFNGGLHLDASLFSPGTLSLGAWADYRGYRAIGGSSADGINYGLRLNALDNTPVRVAASASRNTVDFTSDSSNVRTGTSRVDGLSASAILVDSDYPFLSAAIRTTKISNKVVGASPIKSDSTTMSFEAAQGVESANYRLAYETSWANGDYAESNYDTHLVSLRTAATLAPNFTAKVDATYYLRLPTLTSSINPRIDNQTVSSWLQWGGAGGAFGGGGYSYSSSLFEVPGEPIRESIAHTLSAYGTWQLNTELAMDLNTGASATQTRASLVEQRATGEQVGAVMRWSRPLHLSQVNTYLSGGLGAYQSNASANTGAWSVGAGGGYSFPVSSWAMATSLSCSYDSNTGASAGHRSQVMGLASAMGLPFGWTFTSQLNIGYVASDSPTFGARRSLDARLLAMAQRGGYSFQLNAGVTDALSEVLVPGTPPVTALVPTDFNTQNRYATISATFPTIRDLYLTIIGRYLTFTSPGRATQWESGVTVSAAYNIGAFQLALYDQLTTGGSNVATSTQNLLFFSVSRSFGR